MALLPLDPKTYLPTVLKPYAVGERSGLPSWLERYQLDVAALQAPTAAAVGLIAGRVDEVHAIWTKNIEHSRYGVVCKALHAEGRDAELVLGDPSELARLAKQEQRIADDAAAAGAEMLARWKSLLAQYVAQGGLQPQHREMLTTAAAQQGLDPAVVKRELDAAPTAQPAAAIPATTRDEIRTRLRDYAREIGDENRGLTLYHALGLPGITDDTAAVRAALTEMDARVRQMTHSQAATTARQLLALARIHLLDENVDPRAYVEGAVEDVIDQMTFEAAQAGSDGHIDPNEAEALLQGAIRRGLTPELARRVVVELARRQNAVVESSAPVDYVSCPVCHVPHPRPSAPQTCRSCGSALFVTCPADGCGAVNDGVALRCVDCRADLRRYVEASRQLQTLPTLVDDGRVGQAIDDLRLITEILGSEGVPRELRERIERLEREATSTWQDVEVAVTSRRLYAARVGLMALVRTSPDVVGPTGDTPAVRLRDVERRLTDVDAALVRARSANGAERERALLDAVALAQDCEEAVAALETIPPVAPAAATAIVDSGPVRVSWSRSPTSGASYALRRIDQATGVDHEVGTTNETHFEDRDAPTGAVVRYEVTTRRGRAASSPTRTDALLVAREVEGLTVVDRDSEVRLSWKPVPAGARVVVRRSVAEVGQGVELPTDRTGLVDREARNGVRYAYHVSVEYAGVGDQTVRTTGVTVLGQPVAPPEGIDGLRLNDVDGAVAIGFDQPAVGTVTIVRCDEPPRVAFGDALDAGALAALGRVLPSTRDGARDDSSAGVCWYVPVTVAGSTAVAGRPVRHVLAPPVENLRAEPSGTQVRITWEWPAGVRAARVVWRRDARPGTIDEPGADSATVRLGEYRDHGGFTIETNGTEPLFVAVVPVLRVDGEQVASATIPKSARVSLRPTTKADIRYRVARTGLRKKRLEVTVTAPEGIAPPGLVLVARPGDLLPRTASDGEVLAQLGGASGLHTTIDLAGRSRPLTVRMFLASAGSTSAFQLFDPTADDLLIR